MEIKTAFSVPQLPIGALLISRVQKDTPIEQCAMDISYHAVHHNIIFIKPKSILKETKLKFLDVRKSNSQCLSFAQMKICPKIVHHPSNIIHQKHRYFQKKSNCKFVSISQNSSKYSIASYRSDMTVSKQIHDQILHFLQNNESAF